MPQLITYRGQPVKRRRLTSDGLRLTFYGQRRGESGAVILVTQAAWRLHGRVQFLPTGSMPNVRMLAEHFAISTRNSPLESDL